MGVDTRKGEDVGPTWYDVRGLWHEHERRRRRRLMLLATLQSDQGGRLSIWYRFEVRPAGAPATATPVCYKAAGFPHKDHKTLPGLLYRLLWELENDADVAEAEALEQASF